jgi:hypothetical protein
MMIRIILSLALVLLFGFQSLHATSLAEQIKQAGYIEFCDHQHGAVTFDSLYHKFDELIEFLQANPVWVNKLYYAKERFIRSKERNYYSTDFFGWYDESQPAERGQVSFYYSTHFDDFICARFPEFNQISQITRFFAACRQIEQTTKPLFSLAAKELDLPEIFAPLNTDQQPPVLFKVVKYLPSYVASKPHYDGTAFSLFLDSTDHQALRLAAYKPLLNRHDFTTPARKYAREQYQNSILLIPGTLLTEFAINPTPHVVLPAGKTRYATIAFAMRPHYLTPKKQLVLLPNLKD